MAELVRFPYSGHSWVTWALGDAIYSCESCCNFFKSSVARQNHRRDRSNNKYFPKSDLCKTCSIYFSKKNLVEVGTEALKRITPEQRIVNARNGGIKASLTPNSGRFTTDRWKSMSEEDKREQVLRANKALIDKLNSDSEYKKRHFQKVHKQKAIGYISKGHASLHDAIEHLGFKTHQVIGSLEVDELNEELMVVVEYHGDYWHCNPKKYDKEYYNKSIKMKAKEKWRRDMARRSSLSKLGYNVIIVWESGWRDEPEKYIKRIKEACNEVD